MDERLDSLPSRQIARNRSGFQVSFGLKVLASVIYCLAFGLGSDHATSLLIASNFLESHHLLPFLLFVLYFQIKAPNFIANK